MALDKDPLSTQTNIAITIENGEIKAALKGPGSTIDFISAEEIPSEDSAKVIDAINNLREVLAKCMKGDVINISVTNNPSTAIVKISAVSNDWPKEESKTEAANPAKTGETDFGGLFD